MSADDEDFWEDLFVHIDRRALVTVTGPDLSIVTVDGVEQTLSVAIGPRLAEKGRFELAPDKQTMSDAVVAYLRQGGRDAPNRPYSYIKRIIEELDPKPGEALKKLAGITDLSFFVNTTPDDLLVQALNEIRSQDGSSPTTVVTLSEQQATENQSHSQPLSDANPVVVNLFGQADGGPGAYAIHEEDRLEWLHWLLSKENSIPQWVGLTLRKQPVLFIGCEMPDWLARFFLRMSSSRRLLSLPVEKQFFFVGSSASHEPALTRFCETYCGTARVQRLEMPPDEFVDQLRDRWEQRNPARQDRAPGAPVAEKRSSPDQQSIFLSYMREDVDAVRRLRDSIAGLGGDVWMDERRLEPGAQWETEILTAIRHRIRLFIAVLSINTEREDEGYVFKEWRTALDRSLSIMNRSFIVPVIIDDNGVVDPSRYRNKPNEFDPLNFGFAPAGIPDEGLREMLTKEIRAVEREGKK